MPEELVGRDLVERHVRFEFLHRVEVKRRARKLNAASLRAPCQRLEVSNRQLPLHAGAMFRALGENFRSEQFFDAKKLKLHGVATASRGSVYEFERAREILAMIA